MGLSSFPRLSFSFTSSCFGFSIRFRRKALAFLEGSWMATPFFVGRFSCFFFLRLERDWHTFFLFWPGPTTKKKRQRGYLGTRDVSRLGQKLNECKQSSSYPLRLCMVSLFSAKQAAWARALSFSPGLSASPTNSTKKRLGNIVRGRCFRPPPPKNPSKCRNRPTRCRPEVFFCYQGLEDVEREIPCCMAGLECQTTEGLRDCRALAEKYSFERGSIK